MLVRPIATEKAYHEQTKRTYMFVVPAGASKQAVAQQVADQYKVTVLVSTMLLSSVFALLSAKVKQLALAVVSMHILAQLIAKTTRLLTSL